MDQLSGAGYAIFKNAIPPRYEMVSKLQKLSTQAIANTSELVRGDNTGDGRRRQCASTSARVIRDAKQDIEGIHRASNADTSHHKSVMTPPQPS